MSRSLCCLPLVTLVSLIPLAFGANLAFLSAEEPGSIGGLGLPNLVTLVDPSFAPVLDGAVSLIRQQADDKLIIAGSFTRVSLQPRPGLARLNEDGSLDESFAPLPVPAFISEILLAIDGRILVSGSTNFPGGLETRPLRLNPDGTLDEAFQPPPQVRGLLALQSDGKVLVRSAEPDGSYSLIRLNPDGKLDATFRRPAFSGLRYGVSAADVQPDGTILIVYWSERYALGDFAVTVYTTVLGPDGEDRTSPRAVIETSPNIIQRRKILESGGVLLRFAEEIAFQNRCLAMVRIDAAGTGSALPICHWPEAGSNWPAADYRDGRLIAGTNLVDSTTNVIASLELGAPPSPIGPEPIQDMWIQADGRVVIGGAFNMVHGIALPYLARLIIHTNVGPPTITYISPVQHVFLGQATRFSVQIATGQTPRFEWRHNGQIIPGESHSSLVLTSVGTADVGEYQVIVSNPAGQTAGTTALVVLGTEPPMIRSQPEDVTAQEGGMASYFVEVTNVLARYQWQVNGTNLPGATNATLFLSPVLREMAGDYRAIVSANAGAVTSRTARLTVNAAVPWPGSHPASYYPGPDIDSAVHHVAVAADGKIWMSGSFTNRAGGKHRYLVARLKEDGAFDDSFQLTRNTAPPNWERISQVVPTPDGGAVLKVISSQSVSCGGPCSYMPVFVAKLSSSGAVESEFPMVSPHVAYLAPTRDGMVLVGVDGPVLRGAMNVGRLDRVAPDGALNARFTPPSFEGLSIAGIAVGAAVHSVVEAPDGRIVVAGIFRSGKPVADQYSYTLTRYFANGSIDRELAYSAPPPVAPPGAPILAVQSDKHLLLITADGELQRLNQDGLQDFSFTTSRGYKGLVVLNNDSMLAWGNAINGQGIASSRLVHLRPDGQLDSTFAPQLPEDLTIHSVAARDDGVVIVGGEDLGRGKVLLLYPRRPHSWRLDADGFTVRAATMRSHRYVLEGKDDLSSTAWRPITSLSGTGKLESFTDPSLQARQRFYRIRVE